MSRSICFWSIFILLTLGLGGEAYPQQAPAPVHGIAMHGDLKYPKNFPHFDYVNPNAPQGGELRLGAIGTFDSLNPFVTKGVSPPGLALISETLVYERLMSRSSDEPFSLYGLIAETVEIAPDRSWIIFNLSPQARWSDGRPITAEDVQFTHTLLKEKGRPNLRLFYGKVKSVKILGPLRIQFTFPPLEEGRYDPEMPLLIALMTVLPKHDLEGRDFEKKLLTPFVGSGPYRIKSFKAGHSITYEKREDYWGKDLPVNRGHYNFSTVHYDYYRDTTILKEAFKKGLHFFIKETDPMSWKREYNFKAVEDGRVKKVVHHHRKPVGTTGFVFNTRRAMFDNPKVRRALSYAFDFETLNHTLFEDAYVRTTSFFNNTELSSDHPMEAAEKELLEPFKDEIPSSIFKGEPPILKGGTPAIHRRNLRKARDLLREAGWCVQNGVLKHKVSGRPFVFEILLYQPKAEKIALALKRNLRPLGIDVQIRTVDSAQYERRRMNFEYDMILNTWGATLSPGREQQYYWSQQAANTPGSRNYPGVRCAAIDHLCDVLATAEDRKTMVAAARALSRILIHGHYVIPLYHMKENYIVHWDVVGLPPLSKDVSLAMTRLWYKNGNDKKNTRTNCKKN